MENPFEVLETAFRKALEYRSAHSAGRAGPARSYRQLLADFAAPLPETGTNDAEVIRLLAGTGEPGLMGVTHPQFFGWVMGGSSPVGVAADWLASAWGQNAAYHMSSPTAAAVEEVAAGWLLEILDLPREASVGFTTGGTMGSFVALAAARGAVLRKHGWDADADGLFGAPEPHVFVGQDAHVSVFSALQYLGLGRDRVIRIASDDQGRMDAACLAREVKSRNGPKIIISQAGQINTGAFDPFRQQTEIARDHDAWLHVDGAFGLWARANPDLKPATMGIDGADSWVVDGHKWLQVPFDAGYAIVRDRDAHQQAMAIRASYLEKPEPADRVPCFLVPELSRRARGIPTWAALKSLGRSGVAQMVGHHCAVARHIAARLEKADGIRVLNDVVLNQLVVCFGHAEDGFERRKAMTGAVIDAAMAAGRLFVSGGAWRGEWTMRISVISQTTTMKDADSAADDILSAWAKVSENLRVRT